MSEHDFDPSEPAPEDEIDELQQLRDALAAKTREAEADHDR